MCSPLAPPAHLQLRRRVRRLLLHLLHLRLLLGQRGGQGGVRELLHLEREGTVGGRGGPREGDGEALRMG